MSAWFRGPRRRRSRCSPGAGRRTVAGAVAGRRWSRKGRRRSGRDTRPRRTHRRTTCACHIWHLEWSQKSSIKFDFYRPQRSWAKVIFSQASVILSTGGVCLVRGVSSCGVGLVWEVPGRDHPRTATAAGSVHPTGMHSCYQCCGKVMFSQVFVCSVIGGGVGYGVGSIKYITG